jgi:hypothetical protein
MKRVAHFTKHLFLWLMAVQILNLSVDAIDFKPVYSVALNESNEINSVVEYISELVLGNTNSFPEPTVKQEHAAGQLHKSINFKLYSPEAFQRSLTAFSPVQRYAIPMDDARLSKIISSQAFILLFHLYNNTNFLL